MLKKLPLLVFCFIAPLSASEDASEESEKLEVLQSSKQAIYESTLECQTELDTASFQECWLKVSHKGQAVKNTEIFIDGGMAGHNHGLPTSPKLVWSDDKNAYSIQGLRFSMSGNWQLSFKVNADEDAMKDEINMEIEVN